MNKKILVLRFSALGDVAMTVPVLWSLKQAYPDREIYFVSRPFARDLVAPLEGVHFIPVDFNGVHNGLKGLFTLFRELRKMGPWQLIADLHGVLRSHILTSLFSITGTKVSKIEKGRKEKEALCRKENKVFKPLKHTTVRYRDVFVKGGLPFELVDFPGRRLYSPGNEPLPVKELETTAPKIGVAPFAKHQWKMWPEAKMKTLVKALDDKGVHLFFFGGRGEEQQKLESWTATLQHGHSMAGRLTMQQELTAMAHLDLMISMDSANMHLASLAGTRVVSIWGATHPYAGFYGWGQSPEDAVQIELSCRPSSVFGNKPCYRGDFACMEWLKMEDVLEKVEGALQEMGD